MSENTLEPVSCPYCNAYVPLSGNPGPRLTCPRCGESFPFKGQVASGGRQPPEEGPSLTRGVDAPGSPGRWSNRQIVGTILTAMASMAAVALVYALLTESTRRSRDPKTVVEQTPIVAVQPAELPGLRYLPERSNVVVGLHVADALRTPAGREILTHAPWLRTTSGRLRLEALTGIPLADIDHAVLGLQVGGDDVVPPAVLVVQTRRPIDLDAVKKALQVQRSEDRDGRTVHHFKTDVSLLNPVLWSPDRTTLVIAGRPRDLDAVPRQPGSGVERFPAAVRDRIKERIDRHAQAWLAAHVPELEKTIEPLLTLLPQQESNKEMLQRLQTLSRIRTLDVALVFRAGVALNATFDCADDRTAQALEELLAKPKENALLQPLQTRPEAAAIVQELADNLKHERQGSRLTVQSRAEAETVRQALGAARE